MATEHTFDLPVVAGKRIGLRINGSNVVCAVHACYRCPLLLHLRWCAS